MVTIDYKKRLTNKVILITGAGRSGTTILGKIIGSMHQAYYLFEPSVMKFIRHYTESDELRATIFEDYFLLSVQGRNLNVNKDEDSYFGNYLPPAFLTKRENALRECSRSKLVIKLTEFQDRLKWARRLFPGLKTVHIYRNGNDVVDSMLKRGWYTDEYMETGFLDHVIDNAPCFVYGQAARNFKKYNQITRGACVWRNSVETGLGDDDVLQIRYEDLSHMNFNSLAYCLGLEITDLTVSHIRSIKKPTVHDNVIDQIQEPEKSRFIALMGRLKYA